MNLNPNIDNLSGCSHGRKHYIQVSKSQMKPSENTTLFSVWLDQLMMLREFYEVIKDYLVKKSNIVK